MEWPGGSLREDLVCRCVSVSGNRGRIKRTRFIQLSRNLYFSIISQMKSVIKESNIAQRCLKKAPRNVLVSYEIWARLVEEHGSNILRGFVGYHDEKLAGQWADYRSSRLNKQWRVIYQVQSSNKIEIVSVERVTPHDYRRRK